jgi:hypothetical protein
VTDEIRLGREVDAAAHRKTPAEIDKAHKAWIASVERVAETYAALPTVGDLSLCLRLAQNLMPKGPTEQPSTALGRALLGVTIEAQREMVRSYAPRICGRYIRTLAEVWDDWKDAEDDYADAARAKDVVARTHHHARVRHFRRLMREAIWIYECNEETRLSRHMVRVLTLPREVMVALFDWEQFPELFDGRARDTWPNYMWFDTIEGSARFDEHLAHLILVMRDQVQARLSAETYRTKAFEGFWPMPGRLREHLALAEGDAVL